MLKKQSLTQPYIAVDSQFAERCHCLAPASFYLAYEKAATRAQGQEDQFDLEKVTPIPAELYLHLRGQLDALLPRLASLSILLLHISQLEPVHIGPQAGILHNRKRYHAPASFMEQVLANTRRVIRKSDLILVHESIGAVVIFPDVDKPGIESILERVYNSISLIQAETVIPPLEYETDVVMGVGSYSRGDSPVEKMLYQAGITARRFTLRPAITTQFWQPVPAEESPSSYRDTEKQISMPPVSSSPLHRHAPGNAPYMQLPARIPARLKQLIPHKVALELRCIPVGRDHHCLTVALADPADTTVIQRLQEITGLDIFPVSCDTTALHALLEHKW